MIYLLAKYTLLFLLVAALGFILGYWYARRNIEDVTEAFEDLRKANERSDQTNWDRLWSQLSAMPEPKDTDLSDVYQRLDLVAAAISQLPKPQETDLSSVNKRLDDISTAISRLPQPEKPEHVDLQPLADNLGRIERDIKAIPIPEKPGPIDFSPVTGKIDALQVALRSIPQPEPQRDVDLEPVERRLQAIETELGSLGKRLSQPARVESAPRQSAAVVPRESPRILSAALYGKKDNLRLISGVGPKLEDLLNKNGVYYFWQVADWNDRDIEIMDERLDAFKGRIDRDNWVTQAQRLRRDPNAAKMPANL